MTAYSVIAIALYSLVAISLVVNITQLLIEARELKQDGKTPLVGKNLFALIIASLGEAVTVMLIILLAQAVIAVPGVVTIVIVFLSAFLIRNVVTYLIMWGIWAIFNSAGKKAMTKDVREDIEEERGI